MTFVILGALVSHIHTLLTHLSFSDCPLSVCLSVCKLLHFRLLQNHWATLNQTWYKSSLGEGIQVCSNEGDSPYPGGDDSERVKIHWHLKKKSPESACQIQSNLLHIILWWREFKFVRIKGQILFKEEIITKKYKWGRII
jgi:hypothetical protein